jgi:hypothetical protein
MSEVDQAMGQLEIEKRPLTPFWRRLQKVRDAADIKFNPYNLHSGSSTLNKLRSELRMSDPELAAKLSDPSIGFASGNAAFVDYETSEDMSRAPQVLRRHGLRADPDMPWIVSLLGGGQINRDGDVASQLWDRALSSIFDSPDV